MEIDDLARMETGYVDNQLLQRNIELEQEVKLLREKNEELELRIAAIVKGRGVNSEDKGAVIERSPNEKTEDNGGILGVKTPDKDVNLKHVIQYQVINLDEVVHSSGSRKELFSGEDGTRTKKTDPCTPNGKTLQDTFTTIANNSDDKLQISTADVLPCSKASTIMGQCGEDTSDSNERITFVPTPKRKRSLNVVSSESESEDDDNIPIGQLVKKNLQPSVKQPLVLDSDVDEEFPTHRRRQRLVKLRDCKGRKKAKKTDELEDGSDDDDDSFIASSSECKEEASDVPQDFSESSSDYEGILHRIKRTKDHGPEWEFEADMLSAFGNDPILCMKAVCALYRQQTCNEQQVKETIVRNGRGFSTFDAPRGSNLAEFLTDGDPNNDVTKSVEHLNEYDPNGVEDCRALAYHYSKQLFEIYKNREDSYFNTSSLHD